MHKKQRQSADDKPDTVRFEMIDREVILLIKRLAARGVCPGCIAQAMLFHGAYLYADFAGVEEAVALCLDIADTIDPDGDDGMPVSDTQH